MSAQPNPIPGYPPNCENIAKETVPNGLDLLQAHVYFRHGERTPVKERLTHLGIPSRWELCSKRSEPGSQCGWGELTDTGRMSTFRLGQELRKLYVDKLHLLPPALNSEQAGLLQLQSTAVPRAKESMQEVLKGLLPPGDRLYEPSVMIRDYKVETLYPNPSCALYRSLHKMYIKKAAEDWDDRLLKPLDDKIADVVGVPVRIQSHPTANGVLDTIRGCQAHEIPVPEVFKDPQVAHNLEAAVIQEWFSGYVSKQLSRLSMGRLMGEMSSIFDRCTTDSNPTPRLALYACHDTTLAGMLKVMNCFDNRWPYFTAYLSFELFKKHPQSQIGSIASWLTSRSGSSSTSEEYFVRVKYNAKDLKLPACAPVGKHLEGSDGTVCTLTAFKEAIKDVVLTTEEWQKECLQPMVEPPQNST